MSTIPSPEDMVGCPYNPAHRMLRKRLQPHLIKCRLSYPDVELKKCPFNSTHLIPEPEYIHHVTNCPGKALIVNYKYNSLPLKKEDGPKKHEPIESEENWDDTEVEDYDPKKYSSQAKIIRSHIGDLPSVKKEFRRQERKRLGDYDSDDEDKGGCSKPKKEPYETDDSRIPTPPPAPAWPEEIVSGNGPGWFEDRRDIRKAAHDCHPFRERRLDEDSYCDGPGSTQYDSSRFKKGPVTGRSGSRSKYV